MSTLSANAPSRAWDASRAAASPWLPPAVATTVVVPHPDDEALLFGGLIRLQRRRGVVVQVLAVTDGEGAYPGADPATLAGRRRREQHTSLDRLGVRPPDITRLAIEDGRVTDFVDDLADAIAATEPQLVVAPWVHDHHTDHEACGRAADRAADDVGAALVSGLFWAWHRTPPSMLGTRTLMQLRLDRRTRRARRRALAAHRTQLGTEFGDPVLPDALLGPISWHSEFYVAGPTGWPSREVTS
jgi:LmbE family N-acetylglucosaminyl deacetylase